MLFLNNFMCRNEISIEPKVVCGQDTKIVARKRHEQCAISKAANNEPNIRNLASAEFSIFFPYAKRRGGVCQIN